MQQVQLPTLSTATPAQLVTLAVNGPNTVDGSNLLLTLSRQATGGSFPLASVLAEDSLPVNEFTPRYLSTAVIGCKAAVLCIASNLGIVLAEFESYRSEERRVGKECRSRWSPYH